MQIYEYMHVLTGLEQTILLLLDAYMHAEVDG